MRSGARIGNSSNGLPATSTNCGSGSGSVRSAARLRNGDRRSPKASTAAARPGSGPNVSAAVPKPNAQPGATATQGIHEHPCLYPLTLVVVLDSDADIPACGDEPDAPGETNVADEAGEVDWRECGLRHRYLDTRDGVHVEVSGQENDPSRYHLYVLGVEGGYAGAVVQLQECNPKFTVGGYSTGFRFVAAGEITPDEVSIDLRVVAEGWAIYDGPFRVRAYHPDG